MWFTFFHEAGHILLHGKTKLFLEDDGDRDGQEEEANRFSADLLIPERELRRFKATGERSLEAIKGFAKEVGLAAGIVVGRLQHEGFLPRSHGNGLKVRCEWASTK
ncbi:MAG: ImmA/IrrE family metallo-endopeptidase [Blastocatellia bacterium]